MIERHAFDRDAAARIRGADAEVQSEPTSGRSALRPFRSALFAASDKVDSTGTALRQEMLAALTAATGQAKMVGTWAEWTAAVEGLHPSLLLLMPHTLPDPAFGSPAMEIGPEHSAALASGHVSAAHVTGTPGLAQPLTLLLGCETSISELAYEGLVAAFRRNGAAIVVGTLSTILGRHVVPVAEMLVHLLRERAGHGQVTLGEVIRDARRAALADGLPMALCLVAYGDAQWCIEA